MEIVTKKQAAEMLGCTVQTLDRWNREAIGPRRIVLPSGGVRYRTADIESFISAAVAE